jgi:V-type H+-transporting ATPase subunit E
MINFIQAHGKERVQEIEDESREAFNIEKEKLIESEKNRLEEKHFKDLQNEEVKMKIARSAELNKARIEKMRRTSKLVDSLLFDAKVKMQQKMTDEPDSYKNLMEQMLVQGLIKMIEPKVILKVR